MDDHDADIEFIDINEDETERRPIMLLLKRLIRNKQNTVMTNTQIVEILKEEFSINVNGCHDLEVDIYIKIIKKYLKDWPQWEELERISSKLNNNKDHEAVTKVLDQKYEHLKKYLGVMLDAAKPETKKAVAKVSQQENTNDVVMEVFCTRQQLNHLIFRKPRTDLGNTIFNISKIEPTRISLNTFTFESILNSCSLKMSITLPNFSFVRELEYKFTHKLVNKVREEELPLESLDTRLHYKTKAVLKEVEKSAIFTYLYKILKYYEHDGVKSPLFKIIFQVLKNELDDYPENIEPIAHYRKFANRYKYVRYLYVENTQNTDPNYDLQLEELMAPCYQFTLLKVGRQPEKHYIKDLSWWLKMECTMCRTQFTGIRNLIDEVEAHYNDCHQHDPAWQCTNCKQTFNMDVLSKQRWRHDC